MLGLLGDYRDQPSRRFELLTLPILNEMHVIHIITDRSPRWNRPFCGRGGRVEVGWLILDIQFPNLP